MKTLFLTFLSLIALAVAQGAEGDHPSVVRSVLAQKIKQDFPYTPPAEQKKPQLSEPESKIVMMDRVIVTESFRLREFKHKLEADR